MDKKIEQPVFNTWRGASFQNPNQSVGLKGATAVTLRGTFFITPTKTPSQTPGAAMFNPNDPNAPGAQGSQGAQNPGDQPVEFQPGDPIVWYCGKCGYTEDGVYDGTDEKQCPKCDAMMQPYPPETAGDQGPQGAKRKAAASQGAQSPPSGSATTKKLPPWMQKKGGESYSRYYCADCGFAAISKSEAVTLSCPKCDGLLFKGETTVKLKKDTVLEAKALKTPEDTIRYYIAPAYKAEGRTDLFEQRISEKQGINLVIAPRRGHSEIHESLFFDFDQSKGWTVAKVQEWMKEHGFVVRIEFSENLFHIPKALRNLLGNDIRLAAEWRSYYIKHVDEEFPALLAWSEMKKLYVRDEKGLWAKIV